jgi:hypothetical protein
MPYQHANSNKTAVHAAGSVNRLNNNNYSSCHKLHASRSQQNHTMLQHIQQSAGKWRQNSQCSKASNAVQLAVPHSPYVHVKHASWCQLL